MCVCVQFMCVVIEAFCDVILINMQHIYCKYTHINMPCMHWLRICTRYHGCKYVHTQDIIQYTMVTYMYDIHNTMHHGYVHIHTSYGTIHYDYKCAHIHKFMAENFSFHISCSIVNYILAHKLRA